MTAAVGAEPMRFAVEPWSPDYGVPADDAALAPTTAQVDIEVERPTRDWAPIVPASAATVESIVFVDGVRRVDASVWIETPAGPRQGLCASYAAGAVHSRGGRCSIVAIEAARGLFARAEGAETINTRHGKYPIRAVAGDAPSDLILGVQRSMNSLEVKVASAAGDTDLIVVDGPLGSHVRSAAGPAGRPPLIGYIKTHKVPSLPAPVAGVVADLPAGARTPLFVASSPLGPRYSWYLRLPSRPGHSWVGIVRCEAGADQTVTDAAALANRATVTLVRFASSEHKDPRAPQNLYPIGRA